MCNATANNATQSCHPFEKAGLGKGPFRFVGLFRKVGPITTQVAPGVEVQVGSPGQPMGTCDYCGMGIADCYEVASADGKKFVVGCDCIMKVYKEYGTESADPVKRAIDNARKDAQRKARHAREALKLAEYRAWVEAHRAELEATPNPNRKGETIMDRVDWYARRAGTSGNLSLYKALRERFGA